jgi:hypothetical protein
MTLHEVSSPTCCAVLRVADPTPASWGANPRKPVLKAPNLGNRMRLDIWAVAAKAATKGRNATPVFTGLNPSVPWR